MGKFSVAILPLAAWSAVLFAQESSRFDGRWTGSFATPAGGTVSVELVLTGQAGTWQALPVAMQARDNPCITRKHAVTVHRVSATQLGFSIDASKTLQGCPDGRAMVTLIDDEHLEGRFGDGRAFKLTRK